MKGWRGTTHRSLRRQRAALETGNKSATASILNGIANEGSFQRGGSLTPEAIALLEFNSEYIAEFLKTKSQASR
jgi:hypothetical protein